MSGLALNGEPPITSWAQFATAIRNQYYPIGYKERLWERWQFSRQGKGQSVQEYTTEFRKMALALQVNLRDPDVVEKYKGGLFFSLQTELALFTVTDIDDACKKAMYLELKNRTIGKKSEFPNGHPNHLKPCESGFHMSGKKNNVVAQKGKQYCSHCKTDKHSNESCWILHPEQRPSWWMNRNPRKTTNLCIEEDEVVEGSAEPDLRLATMAIKGATTASRIEVAVPISTLKQDATKEELFWVHE